MTIKGKGIGAASEAAPKAPPVSTERHRFSGLGIIVDSVNALGSLMILALMFLVLADIFGRGVLNQPLYGVAELAGMSVIVLIFAQLPSAIRHNRLARIDIFIELMRDRAPVVGVILRVFWRAVAAVVCCVIFVSTWPVFRQAWVTDEFIGNVGLFTAPTWPMRLAVLVGSALATAQLIVLGISDALTFNRGRRGSRSAAGEEHPKP